MTHNHLDELLEQALKVTQQPDEKLIQALKDKIERPERNMQTLKRRTKYLRMTAAAAVLAAVTILAVAAWNFLKPADIAGAMQDHALSAAFASEDALEINQTVQSGDYIFTLLGVVSGKDISDMQYEGADVQEERTYAALAIRYADGSPMPDAQDADYGETPFFATPLVKGLAPWQVNAATMNGDMRNLCWMGCSTGWWSATALPCLQTEDCISR